MRSSRLFRTIWRINGVLLLLAFVLVAGTVAVAAVASMSWGRRDRGEAPAAVVAATGEELFFGSVEEIEGSPLVLIPLHARRPSKLEFSSGGTATRNLLFYDAASGAARWLRADHGATVFSYVQLRESGSHSRLPPSGEKDPVRWIRYELATADTNHDGEVDGRDAVQLALTDADGKNLTVVIDGIDSVLGYASPRRGELVVFFRKSGTDLAGEIDLATRKLVKTVPLPRS